MTDSTPKLKAGELAELIRAGGEAIVIEALSLTDAAARFHPEPGEWSVNEVVGHLIEAENRGFAGHMRLILDRDGVALPGWDAEEIARSRRDDERKLSDLVKELRLLRADSVGLVFRLRAEDFDRGGMHPLVGRLTIGDIVFEWVHHDREHLKQMFTNVQRFVWPHMGGAQKFSEL